MTGEPAIPQAQPSARRAPGWLERLRARGVLRVAASYGVIAWLLLQIADVVFEPLGVPHWAMIALLITLALGLPVAVLLAWFYELTPAGVAIDGASAAAPRPTVQGVRRYADLVIIVALLVVVAVLLARQPETGGDAASLESSLAVMPFTNIGGNPDNEYLSDGLAEELLDQIGRVPGMRVSARSSSFYFKGQNIDAVTAAKKLGVAAVLEGSVRRQGQKQRISVRLINGANGFQLWSSTFEGAGADLMRTQQEIARSVVEALMPRFASSGGAVPAAVTTSVTAHDLYLLGRYEERHEAGDSEKAIGLYRQAVAADPTFALAHAALGRYMLTAWLMEGEVSAREEAEQLIRRAVTLDPQSSEAHEALGNFLRWTEQTGAGREYGRAVELNPNNTTALAAHANHLSLAGNPRKAIEILRRALAVDPALLENYYELAGMAARMQRRDETYTVVQQAFDFFGKSAATHILAAEMHSGFAGLPEEDVCVAHALLAHRMEPGVPHPYSLLSVCLMRMNVLGPARTFAQATASGRRSFVAMTALIDKADGSEKALEYAQSVLLRRPRDQFLSIIIANLLTIDGRPAEALETYRSINMPAIGMDEAIRQQAGVWGLNDMAATHIELGNRAEGERIARWMLEFVQRVRVNGVIDREEEAGALAVLGRTDEAIALLKEQAATMGIWSKATLYTRPAYQSLRNDPRLREVAALSDAHWAKIRAQLPQTLKTFGLTMQDIDAAERDAAEAAERAVSEEGVNP